jgi:hypothetical protein
MTSDFAHWNLRCNSRRAALWSMAVGAAGSFGLAAVFVGCGSSSAGAPGGDAGDAAVFVGDTEVTSDADQGGGDVSSGDGGAGEASTTGSDDGQGAVDTGSTGQCPLTEVFALPCNVLSPSGSVVTSTCSSAEPPQAQGGTVADGTYVLESVTWYGTCQPAEAVQSVWVVCGGLWDVATNAPGTDAGLIHTNYTSAVQGTAVTLNPICSSGGSMPGVMHDYTVSGRHLAMTTSYGASILVSVYTLQ